MKILFRVTSIMILLLGLLVTGVVMILTGYVPAKRWSAPQHEVIFSMIVGGMGGIIVTLMVLLGGSLRR